MFITIGVWGAEEQGVTSSCLRATLGPASSLTPAPQELQVSPRPLK